MPRSPDDHRCPHNGAGVAHAGQIRHPAPTLRPATPMLPALSATRFVRPRWPTIGHCLVTRRRRLHNATHHVERGYPKTFRLRTRSRTRTAPVQSVLVSEKAGSGRPSRPRCAPRALSRDATARGPAGSSTAVPPTGRRATRPVRGANPPPTPPWEGGGGGLRRVRSTSKIRRSLQQGIGVLRGTLRLEERRG